MTAYDRPLPQDVAVIERELGCTVETLITGYLADNLTKEAVCYKEFAGRSGRLLREKFDDEYNYSVSVWYSALMLEYERQEAQLNGDAK